MREGAGGSHTPLYGADQVSEFGREELGRVNRNEPHLTVTEVKACESDWAEELDIDSKRPTCEQLPGVPTWQPNEGSEWPQWVGVCRSTQICGTAASCTDRVDTNGQNRPLLL